VTESIGRQAGRGLRFSLAGTLLTKLGSFAMGLVLARLLAPSDFGVYAIALAATAVLMHINDVGLIAATVQWRGRLEDMAPTAAGAFSFAWGQVTGAAMTGLLVFLFGRVPFRYGFDRAIARKLLVFGVPLAASLGVEAVVTNVQFAVVGHITGAVALGYFLLAFNVASWAQSILGQAIRYVSVAGFSRLSEHDDQALSAGVQRSVPLMVTVVAPIVALTSVLAVPMVALLYGERWLPAAPVLRIL